MEGSSLLTRTAEPLIATTPRATSKKTRATARPKAGSPLGGAAVWSRLYFTMLHQEQSNWCWCATSLSVRRYYDPTATLSQCQAANTILPRTDACADPTNANVNKPWFLDDALTDLGNLREPIVTGTVAWDATKSEIDTGHPLGCRTAWSGGGAHFICIEGYLDDTTKMVAVDDPIYGQSDSTLTAFLTMYQGSGTWTHSYKVKPNRIRLLDAKVPPRCGSHRCLPRCRQARCVRGGHQRTYPDCCYGRQFRSWPVARVVGNPGWTSESRRTDRVREPRPTPTRYLRRWPQRRDLYRRLGSKRCECRLAWLVAHRQCDRPAGIPNRRGLAESRSSRHLCRRYQWQCDVGGVANWRYTMAIERCIQCDPGAPGSNFDTGTIPNQTSQRRRSGEPVSGRPSSRVQPGAVRYQGRQVDRQGQAHRMALFGA
jgi:hypothetical protein